MVTHYMFLSRFFCFNISKFRGTLTNIVSILKVYFESKMTTLLAPMSIYIYLCFNNWPNWFSTHDISESVLTWKRYDRSDNIIYNTVNRFSFVNLGTFCISMNTVCLCMKRCKYQAFNLRNAFVHAIERTVMYFQKAKNN